MKVQTAIGYESTVLSVPVQINVPPVMYSETHPLSYVFRIEKEWPHSLIHKLRVLYSVLKALRRRVSAHSLRQSIVLPQLPKYIYTNNQTQKTYYAPSWIFLLLHIRINSSFFNNLFYTFPERTSSLISKIHIFAYCVYMFIPASWS